MQSETLLAAARIVASVPWLTLASIDAGGSGHASYVPFAPLSDGLGIAVSRLATHTTNVLRHPQASVLIVSEDSAPAGSYARARLSIDVLARPSSPGSEIATTIWSALEARHGEVAAMLRTLPDFTAFLLEPFQARLILGFAAAHDLAQPDIASLLSSAVRR